MKRIATLIVTVALVASILTMPAVCAAEPMDIPTQLSVFTDKTSEIEVDEQKHDEYPDQRQDDDTAPGIGELA